MAIELPPYRIECPECETEFEGTWMDDSMSMEDMTETPVAEQECPNPDCGHKFQAEWPGWMNWTEAG